MCVIHRCVSGGQGPRRWGSPEARGSSRQWLGFGAGRALQSVPISLLPPCDIQKTAVAIGSVCVHTRYVYTETHTPTHTQLRLIGDKTLLCLQARATFFCIIYSIKLKIWRLDSDVIMKERLASIDCLVCSFLLLAFWAFYIPASHVFVYVMSPFTHICL